MDSRNRPFLLTLCIAAILGATAVAAAEEVALSSPPQDIVDMARNITWRYYYGHSQSAHTNDASSCGRTFTLAVAAHADNTTADYRFFRQIRYNLLGDYCIVAAGGYGSQHERIFTGSCCLIKHNSRLWDQLTADEKNKMDLLMKAALVASAYTTSDDGNEASQNTDMMGGTNLARGWNPNFREGMIGGMIISTIYLGGGAAADAFLDSYDHSAFTAQLNAAGLTNTYITFNYKVDNPGSSAPTGAMIEADIDNYRYLGRSLSQLMEIYWLLGTFTYDKNVNTGLNGGAGYDGGGYMMAGQAGLPNLGALGMLHELDGSDGSGPRSSITYAYFGYRPNLINQIVMLCTGYWEPGAMADQCVAQMEIGIEDLFYKLDYGYMNYSNGGVSGPNYMTDAGWDYYMTKSLWYDVVAPYHASAQQPPVADAGPDQNVTDTDDNGSEDVTLDGSGSYDNDGTITSYVWEENSSQIATGVSPVVTLSVAVHTIDLTVTDNDSQTDTDSVVITVNPAGPPANIEFDAVSSSAATSTSSLSWSHTIGGGSNRILIVGVENEDDVPGDMVISSVTYNSVAMDLVTGSQASVGSSTQNHTALYYLLDANLPAAGGYTVAVTYAGENTRHCAGAISLAEVAQQPAEAVTTNSLGAASDISTNITTLTDGAWVVDAVHSGHPDTMVVNAAGMVGRYSTSASGGQTGAGSTKPMATAGLTTMSWDYDDTGTARLVHSVAAFAPAGGQTNNPPTVDAGSDQSIMLPVAADLDGTVADDGRPNPPAAVTTTWTKDTGPGTVTFGDAAAVDTTASFSVEGAYVLQLEADDSELTAADTVTITVYPPLGAPTFVDNFDPGWDATQTDWRIATWMQNGTQMALDRCQTDGAGLLVQTVLAGLPYRGGSMQSKAEYTYGRWVARIKPSPVSGVLNTMFTKDYDDMTTPTPDDDGTGFEIDIELLTHTFGPGVGQVHLAIHAEGQPGLHVADIDLGFNPSDDFHEWGFDIYPDQVDWHVDGTIFHTWHAPGGVTVADDYEMFFNSWTRDTWILGPPATDAEYYIDWVSFAPIGGGPANIPPTADAGPDQNVDDLDDSGDEDVTLDGSASDDPDGTIVSYEWEEASVPIASGVSPVVTLSVAVHTIDLIVTDDDTDTDTDSVQITVNPYVNVPPTADAGPDQNVDDLDDSGDEDVTLDGSGSTDSDGTIVSYDWEESSVPIATGVSPLVTLSVAVHTIDLIVTDDDTATDTDSVIITVNPYVNVPPTADAGPDQNVDDLDDSGDEDVTLDGSGSSDSDGTIVSYEWEESSVPIATGVSPLVTLSVAVHTIDLIVTDDDTATDTDSVIITVNPAPGSGAAFIVGNTTLGSGDAAVNAALAGLGYTVTLVDDDVATAADGSGMAVVVISASVNGNVVLGTFRDVTVPVVTWEKDIYDDMDLTTDQNVVRKQTQIDIVDSGHAMAAGLSGTVSAYTGNEYITWGAPTVNADVVATVAGDAAKATIFGYETAAIMANGFAAPSRRVGMFMDADSASVWTADGQDLLEAAVTWAANAGPPANQPPVADAGPDQNVTDTDEGGDEDVTLDGSGSYDSDGTIISYEWEESSVPIASGVSPLVTLSVAVHTIDLTVTDDDTATDTDSVIITVSAPMANEVLFVAGTPTLGAADQVVAGLLTTAGYTVTPIEDVVATAGDATGKVLVVISATVNGNVLLGTFRTVAVPVVTWEKDIYDDMDLTTAQGTQNKQTQVAVVDPGHAMAAGLSGTVTVYAPKDYTTWGTPTAGADVVATVPGDGNKAVLFGYDAAAVMANGYAAPARRVGVFLDANSAEKLTTDGASLIDAALSWALGL